MARKSKIQIWGEYSAVSLLLGFLGVLLGAGNAAGGYVVTERMLEMFKSSRPGRGEAR